MANPWFRFYAEFASDPKVQSMTDSMQRRLVMLMCLRCSDVTVTLCDEELAFALRVTQQELEETKRLFIAKKFIDDRWNLLNWDKRQFLSDSSKQRTKKYRNKRKNVTVTAAKRHGDDTDTDTDTETETNTPENRPATPTGPTAPVEPSHSAPTRPNGVNGANALAEGNLFPTIQENQADPPPPAKASQKTSDAKVSQQQAWFNEWWAQYWRKDDKKPAWKAFRKYIHTEKHYERMLAAFRRASPEMLYREKPLRPMGASWLNKEPWLDGEDDSPPRVIDIQSGRMPPASSTNGHRQNLPPAAGWREL